MLMYEFFLNLTKRAHFEISLTKQNTYFTYFAIFNFYFVSIFYYEPNLIRTGTLNSYLAL